MSEKLEIFRKNMSEKFGITPINMYYNILFSDNYDEDLVVISEGVPHPTTNFYIEIYTKKIKLIYTFGSDTKKDEIINKIKACIIKYKDDYLSKLILPCVKTNLTYMWIITDELFEHIVKEIIDTDIVPMSKINISSNAGTLEINGYKDNKKIIRWEERVIIDESKNFVLIDFPEKIEWLREKYEKK